MSKLYSETWATSSSYNTCQNLSLSQFITFETLLVHTALATTKPLVPNEAQSRQKCVRYLRQLLSFVSFCSIICILFHSMFFFSYCFMVLNRGTFKWINLRYITLDMLHCVISYGLSMTKCRCTAWNIKNTFQWNSIRWHHHSPTSPWRNFCQLFFTISFFVLSIAFS